MRDFFLSVLVTLIVISNKKIWPTSNSRGGLWPLAEAFFFALGQTKKKPKYMLFWRESGFCQDFLVYGSAFLGKVIVKGGK